MELRIERVLLILKGQKRQSLVRNRCVDSYQGSRAVRCIEGKNGKLSIRLSGPEGSSDSRQVGSCINNKLGPIISGPELETEV